MCSDTTRWNNVRNRHVIAFIQRNMWGPKRSQNVGMSLVAEVVVQLCSTTPLKTWFLGACPSHHFCHLAYEAGSLVEWPRSFPDCIIRRRETRTRHHHRHLLNPPLLPQTFKLHSPPSLQLDRAHLWVSLVAPYPRYLRSNVVRTP